MLAKTVCSLLAATHVNVENPAAKQPYTCQDTVKRVMQPSNKSLCVPVGASMCACVSSVNCHPALPWSPLNANTPPNPAHPNPPYPHPQPNPVPPVLCSCLLRSESSPPTHHLPAHFTWQTAPGAPAAQNSKQATTSKQPQPKRAICRQLVGLVSGSGSDNMIVVPLRSLCQT